jgi:hypothetical protein
MDSDSEEFTQRILASFGDSALAHGECCVCLEQKPNDMAVLIGSEQKRVCRHFLCCECAERCRTPVLERAVRCCPVCRKGFSSVEKLPNPLIHPERTYKLLDSNGDGQLQQQEVRKRIDCASHQRKEKTNPFLFFSIKTIKIK